MTIPDLSGLVNRAADMAETAQSAAKRGNSFILNGTIGPMRLEKAADPCHMDANG